MAASTASSSSSSLSRFASTKIIPLPTSSPPPSQLSLSFPPICSRLHKTHALGSARSFSPRPGGGAGPCRPRISMNTGVVISLSTGALLFLGRFVFLPFQRAQLAKAGLPQQNGVTHFQAGDGRAQEVVSVLKTNDPAGFTLVDVLAWGALGHAIGFFILATASNGYQPQF